MTKYVGDSLFIIKKLLFRFINEFHERIIFTFNQPFSSKFQTCVNLKEYRLKLSAPIYFILLYVAYCTLDLTFLFVFVQFA